MNRAPVSRNASVLIVEDDSAIIRALRDSFSEKKYAVYTAMDGASALDTAMSTPVDIILMDVTLPKITGFDLCVRLRQEQVECPIIMLTSKNEEKDIVRGLNLGADDYVTKPFSMVQLQARCAAFLRRNKKCAPQEYRFGPYTLNNLTHKLTDENDKEISLAPREYALLEYFLNREGHALTRETLLQAVWKNRLMVTDRSVDRCINTLRKKIEPNTRRPTYIHAIRDVGYRFVIPVEGG